MASMSTGSLSSAPNGKLVDFEIAELRKVPFEDSLYLWVRGTLPVHGAKAKLAPRVYHDRPDYWGIEVAVVTMPDEADVLGDDTEQLGVESLMFERSVQLSGITGNRGITVIGANQIKQIEITSESF
jgi:hypothetical protein